VTGAEHVLDVSLLPPPEPFERAVEAIERLGAGEFLRMRHRREPLLLFPELEQQGYDWHVQHAEEAGFEVLIWRRDDAAARAAAARAMR